MIVYEPTESAEVAMEEDISVGLSCNDVS